MDPPDGGVKFTFMPVREGWVLADTYCIKVVSNFIASVNSQMLSKPVTVTGAVTVSPGEASIIRAAVVMGASWALRTRGYRHKT